MPHATTHGTHAITVSGTNYNTRNGALQRAEHTLKHIVKHKAYISGHDDSGIHQTSLKEK